LNDPRSSPPIFVTGVPRSGTTLLAAMLGAHPRLVCGPENYFFQCLPEVGARALCRRADWPKAALDFLFSIRYGSRSKQTDEGESMPAQFGLTRRELTEALARREPSIPSILSGMLDLYMERNGKQRWVEKTPGHLLYTAEIRKYYPDSPIIRIVRDPRDVARSQMAMPVGAVTMLQGLAGWRRYDELSAPFFEVDSRCHTLRYEDMVRQPEPTLRELCRAIGEDFDPAMLDTAKSASLVNAANEPYKVKVAEVVDASRAEAWREGFSEDELRLFEACVGDRLRAYGYGVLGFEFSHYIEVHSLAEMGRHPEVAAELVARGARFWRMPGERPEQSLFLGDPDAWLYDLRDVHRVRLARTTRLARAARLAGIVVRHRLGGVPVAWVQAPGQAKTPGRCAKALTWVLPRPTVKHPVPKFAHPGDPA
jgi:hypothetical protein